MLYKRDHRCNTRFISCLLLQETFHLGASQLHEINSLECRTTETHAIEVPIVEEETREWTMEDDEETRQVELTSLNFLPHLFSLIRKYVCFG